MPPVARIVASNGLSNHRPSNPFEVVFDVLQVLGCMRERLEFSRFGGCLDFFLDGIAFNVFSNEVIARSFHGYELSTRTFEAGLSVGLKSTAQTSH
jgi:hypothetical protein